MTPDPWERALTDLIAALSPHGVANFYAPPLERAEAVSAAYALILDATDAADHDLVDVTCDLMAAHYRCRSEGRPVPREALDRAREALDRWRADRA